MSNLPALLQKMMRAQLAQKNEIEDIKMEIINIKRQLAERRDKNA